MTGTYDKTPKEQELVLMKGLNVHRLMLKTARKYYDLALQVFLGEGLIVLANKLKGNKKIEELRKMGNSAMLQQADEWLDVSGLFMPISQLNQLLIEVKRGAMKSIEQVQDFFNLQYKQYPVLKSWYYINVLQERRGIDLLEITLEQIEQIILDWKKALIKLNNMILKDAEKEFDATSKIGYGILNDESLINADFEGVHGKFEENGFVIGLRKEIEMVEQKAEEIISMFG